MKGLEKVVIVAVLALFAGYIWIQNNEMNRVQQGIAEKIIRFHVRANSDTKEDQELKLKVKDAVCEYLSEALTESESLEETKQILTDNTEHIKAIAGEIIAQEGKNYEIDIYFEHTYFPLKTYGDMTFPPGEYEAFRIDIGEAKGENWWCVMYPPLCFVDATYGIVPESSKEQFAQILTAQEYDAITIRNAKDQKIKLDFKWFDH